jgi:hypothetical protein
MSSRTFSQPTGTQRVSPMNPPVLVGPYNMNNRLDNLQHGVLTPVCCIEARTLTSRPQQTISAHIAEVDHVGSYQMHPTKLSTTLAAPKGDEQNYRPGGHNDCNFDGENVDMPVIMSPCHSVGHGFLGQPVLASPIHLHKRRHSSQKKTLTKRRRGSMSITRTCTRRTSISLSTSIHHSSSFHRRPSGSHALHQRQASDPMWQISGSVTSIAATPTGKRMVDDYMETLDQPMLRTSELVVPSDVMLDNPFPFDSLAKTPTQGVEMPSTGTQDQPSSLRLSIQRSLEDYSPNLTPTGFRDPHRSRV